MISLLQYIGAESSEFKVSSIKSHTKAFVYVRKNVNMLINVVYATMIVDRLSVVRKTFCPFAVK